MSAPVRTVTVFVSSPTDVMAERERAGRVIDRLQSRFREVVRIKAIFFEDAQKYYTADRGFQEQIPDAADADLVVSVFWARLGSELSPEAFGTMPDGRPYPGGAVYELARAIESKRQRQVPDILVYRKVAETGISVVDPEQRRLMTAQLDAFEAFWRQWFVSREGHFRAGFQTFRRPDDFERLLDGHLRAWLEDKGLLGKEVVWRIADRGSPFRGLEPYEPEHREVFFGREREIDRGRERLLAAAAGGAAFLLVMGASGAGKSSLVRAGLVTRLTQPGDIDGVDEVRFAALRPGASDAPQRALAEALFREEALPELATGDFPAPDQLVGALAGEGKAATAPVLRALDRAAAKRAAERTYDRPVETRLVLLVDQFEELFSAAVAEPARQCFVRLLGALARSGRVYVIATLRSADYGAFARESELLALKDAGATLDVGVPGPELLGEIVRRPAAAAGLAFERRDGKGLDEALLASAGGNADALPLLGFTLQFLFEHRTGELLTHAAYEELGGLEGAIGRAAEQAFAELDAAAQGALPRLLRGLAEDPQGGGGLSLRDLPLADAPEGSPLRRLADALVAARVLLVRDKGQGASLRLAHEAVLRGWARAREIAEREQDFFRIRAEAAAAERRWRATKRNDLLLAGGLPLAEAQSLKAQYGTELAPELAEFIDASAGRARRRQRLGYALALVFGVVALAAVGAGAIAWRQQQIAQAEAERAELNFARAERNFEAAKSTVDAVIFDLVEGLRHVEGMQAQTARRILGRAEAALARLASKTGDDPAVRRMQAVVFALFSEFYLKLGDTALASEYARKAADIFRALAAASPGDAAAERDLALTLERSGESLAAQGDLAGALAVFREQLAIARALAAKEPNNKEWRRGVLKSLNRVGETLWALGDLESALAAFNESLDLARALAAEEPDNAMWQGDVAVGLDRVGLIRTARGDWAGALSVYREAVEMGRALAARQPDIIQWRRDLSVGLGKLGEALRAQGDFEGALAAFREGLDIARGLAAKDPSNTEWQRDLSISLDQVGSALKDKGDLAAALAAFRESLGIRRALVAKDPANAQWRRDLAIALDHTADALQAQGDLAGALAALRESLDLRRALAAQDGGDAERQRDLSGSIERVGDVLQAQGDLVGALALFRESLGIRRAVAARDPGRRGWQADLSAILDKIGDLLQAQDDLAGALASYRESLAIARALAAEHPGDARLQLDLTVALDNVGDILESQGDVAVAIAAFREALDLRRALLAKDPDNAKWRRAVAVSLIKLGAALRELGDRTGALAALRESLAIARALVATNRLNADWQRDTAVALSNMADVLLEEGDRTGALAAYRENLEIRRMLAAKDWSNTRWQTDLVLALWKLADAGDNARMRFSEALDILTRLKSEGRLTRAQVQWIDTIKAALAKPRPVRNP